MLFATIELLSNKNNRKLILQKNKLVSIGLLSLAVVIACVQHKYSYKSYEYQSESEEYEENEDEESECTEEEYEEGLSEDENQSDIIPNSNKSFQNNTESNISGSSLNALLNKKPSKNKNSQNNTAESNPSKNKNFRNNNTGSNISGKSSNKSISRNKNAQDNSINSNIKGKSSNKLISKNKNTQTDVTGSNTVGKSANKLLNEKMSKNKNSQDNIDEDEKLSNINEKSSDKSVNKDLKNTTDQESNRSTIDIVVQKGETICTILGKQGVSQSEALKISSSISKIFKLKNIRTGLKITLNLNNDNNITNLERLEFKPNPKYKVIVNKNKSNFVAIKENVKLKKVIHSVSGTINPKSIKNSLQKCNIEKKMEKEAMSVLKNVTNVQSVKKPIDFDLVYEKYYDEENKNIENKFLCISAVIDGKIKRIYKFNNDGNEEYIHADGTVISTSRGSMFIQPISYYKKITSKFGPRVHPISGRYKVHTGVDFSANVGTPIKAAASGTVTKASWMSGYGKYISINHSGDLKTNYAHLSKILVKNGQYVKQGDIIAYSGNSGNSTGPHLHYEVSKNGKFINPLSFVPKQPRQLTGRKLAQFNHFKHSINLRVAKLNSQKIKSIV